jgi:hypothetical protein
VKVSSLTTASAGGLAVQANDGKSIYYFGGTSTYTIIQKFETETNYTGQLRTILPSPVLYAAGVSNNKGTLFIHDGKYTRNIIEFEEVSETVKIIGDLQFQSASSSVFSTAALLNGQEDGGVWVFAGNDPRPTYPILLFNMVTQTVSIPTGSSTFQFPTLFEMPATVTDGQNGYLIGGLGRAVEKDGSLHPTNGILK